MCVCVCALSISSVSVRVCVCACVCSLNIAEGLALLLFLCPLIPHLHDVALCVCVFFRVALECASFVVLTAQRKVKTQRQPDGEQANQRKKERKGAFGPYCIGSR